MTTERVIKRVAFTDDGVFGVFLMNNIPFAVTLERSYTPDEFHRVVKIPAGIYRCTKSYYYKGGYDTFEIHVPEHSRVLFHIGNTEGDSDGCVLVGEEYGVLAGKPAILRSGAGFREFMNLSKHLNYFDITIQD